MSWFYEFKIVSPFPYELSSVKPKQAPNYFIMLLAAVASQHERQFVIIAVLWPAAVEFQGLFVRDNPRSRLRFIILRAKTCVRYFYGLFESFVSSKVYLIVDTRDLYSWFA